jgi:hypothetical protein
MSSNYSILCVSHDPAIDIYGDDSSQLTGPLDAMSAAANPSETAGLESHVDCDLLVARYSGCLIELACPGGENCKPGYHGPDHDSWTPVGWLRLLHATFSVFDDALLKSLNLPRCWTYQRVRRLGPLLLVDVVSRPAPETLATGGVVDSGRRYQVGEGPVCDTPHVPHPAVTCPSCGSVRGDDGALEHRDDCALDPFRALRIAPC